MLESHYNAMLSAVASGAVASASASASAAAASASVAASASASAGDDNSHSNTSSNGSSVDIISNQDMSIVSQMAISMSRGQEAPPSGQETPLSDEEVNFMWKSQIIASELLRDELCPLSLTAKRHKELIQSLQYERQAWRIRERMKTASVALVLCLNIGVDPPDVVKIQPCSRLECWIDPSSVSPPKAMEQIGNNLQMQYERWQPRARYKKCHDPTVEDVKKLCTSLRRNAKGERILFHYNGHGVPKPTANGEIWVFNKTFTQYIPLSIFELITWMSAPSIYVYDCSNAGIIINSFQPYAEQHEHELEKALAAAQARGGLQQLMPGSGAGSAAAVAANQVQLPNQLVSYKNCIHLAACAANEILPMNAQLPADLFTSCLTTPINIALKWYAMQEKLGMVPRIQSELIDKIPGKVNDRRTMMGELNWIFTAITDTIAWNTLPRELFQRLFRQDLLVASLFRNFLLAERILRSHDCTPVSLPALPPCYRHPMWKAWDLVVDLALQQLPDILDHNAPYRQLPFFEHQLTAFQVWLDSESESRMPPEQLPIVLQVLLSQVHRLRALELLARFLDLGPWAVNLALGVGIFPYVLKLLQSSTRELRPVLVFIWAKILAVDPSCQVDLVKEYKYFLSVLQDTSVSKEHRTLSAFVLASIVHNFLLGQTSALQGPLLSICLEQLNDGSWLLRQWLAICLGMLWQNFEKARWSGARDLAHEKLYVLLRDSIPEVRAAAVFALGTFISSVTDRSEEQANNIDRIIAITMLETVGEDMSPLVRMELAAALQWMVLLFESQFVAVYLAEHMRGHASASSFVMCGDARDLASSTHSLERHVTMRRGASSSSISNMGGASATSGNSSGTSGRSKSGSGASSGAGAAGGTNTIPFQSIFTKLWLGICNLAQDPFPRVAAIAQEIVDHVRDTALCPIMAAKEATMATASEKCSSLSVSLPPSPNTRVNYLGGGGGGGGGAGGAGESPPVGAAASGASHWAQKLRLSGGGGATGDPQTILQRKLRTSSINDETDSGIGYSRGSAAAAGAGLGLPSGPRESTHSARSSGSESNQYLEPGHCLTPIVQTEFIPWAISYFTRPGKDRYSSAEGAAEEGRQRFPVDRNSTELRRRRSRYLRNDYVRRLARRQQQEQSDRFAYDVCVWNRKTQFTPSIVKLLPYEPQIAVAYREKVLVYDFQWNSVRTYGAEALEGARTGNSSGSGSGSGSSSSLNGSTPRKTGPFSTFARVSSIEFINAQDQALKLVAHDDGVVRVWQSSPPTNAAADDPPAKARLVTAWTALGLPAVQGYRQRNIASGGSIGKGADSSSLLLGGSGSGTGSIVTAWQQCSQHLVVGGGGCRFIRIWDVERELKLSDLPLGRSETCARVLAPYLPNMRCDVIVAGCEDGSVRLFDSRCSLQYSAISVHRRHTAPILHACLRANTPILVSGCSEGRISVVDMRTGAGHRVLHEWDAGNDVTAIASHQIADRVACGNASKIGIYSMDGRVQKVLRTNEGFIGPKIGHPTCLSFHAYKVQLAVGFVDNTVAIYSPTPGRESLSGFYKRCGRWKTDVDKNPETLVNARRFLAEPPMQSAVEQVRSSTRLPELQTEDVQLMYTVCAFETAWRRPRDGSRSSDSVWCSFFDLDALDALEFFEDLEYYWNDGYGYELTHRIACPAIADMFEAIGSREEKQLPGRANATLYFTHSGTLLKLLAHLGLARDEQPLTHKHFASERRWRTSQIDAFATNLAFLRYDCIEEEPHVLILHQERVVRLPQCPQDKDLCPLATLRQIYAESVDNCDFEELCRVE